MSSTLPANNLSFLTGRTPLAIPGGILPEEFDPVPGSVYGAFAPGMPPVIFLNGEFYPLTDEELEFLKQQYTSNATASSRGPEGIPQMPAMPQMPSNFEKVDDLRRFEQKQETKAEKQESANEIAKPAPTPAPQTAPVIPPKPTVLVNISDIMGQGKSFVNQSTVDDAFRKYKQGQLKPKANPGDDAAGWLRLLLVKLFEKQYSDKKSTED